MTNELENRVAEIRLECPAFHSPTGICFHSGLPCAYQQTLRSKNVPPCDIYKEYKVREAQ